MKHFSSSLCGDITAYMVRSFIFVGLFIALSVLLGSCSFNESSEGWSRGGPSSNSNLLEIEILRTQLPQQGAAPSGLQRQQPSAEQADIKERTGELERALKLARQEAESESRKNADEIRDRSDRLAKETEYRDQLIARLRRELEFASSFSANLLLTAVNSSTVTRSQLAASNPRPTSYEDLLNREPAPPLIRVQNPPGQNSTANIESLQAAYQLGIKHAEAGGMWSLISLIALSVLILAAGFWILNAIVGEPLWPRQSQQSDSNPLRPYSLQVLGLTFVLPVLLIVSVSLRLPSEAITALLGAIIGSIFGSKQTTDITPRNTHGGPESQRKTNGADTSRNITNTPESQGETNNPEPEIVRSGVVPTGHTTPKEK